MPGSSPKVRARKPRSASREPLSRERIAVAALELIDRVGIDDFSTRRLGAALGCEAMALYNHYPSKDAVLDAVVDRMMQKLQGQTAPQPQAPVQAQPQSPVQPVPQPPVAAQPQPSAAAQPNPSAIAAQCRLLDTAGRFDEAFARYASANAVVRQNWPQNGDGFDAKLFSGSVNRLIEAYTPKRLADAAAKQDKAALRAMIMDGAPVASGVATPVSTSSVTMRDAPSRSTIATSARAPNTAALASTAPPNDPTRSGSVPGLHA